LNTELQDKLQSYIAHAASQWQRPLVNNLVRISSGWECDVYSFTVEHGDHNRRQNDERVLRVYQGGLAYRESVYEFLGMRALHEEGYPVPEVYFVERDASPFRKPFTVMQRIHGHEMWPLMFPSPSEVIPEMLDLFVRLFTQLHLLDYRPFLPYIEGHVDVSDPLTFVNRELEQWEKRFSQFGIPGFRPVAQWLGKHKNEVPCRRPSVIHWDFHPGNILVCDDGNGSVIDWTGWDISDARFDLAWTLLLISTQRDDKWREVILREYEEQSQDRVEGIEFFDVAACAKRLYFVVAAFQDGPEALGLRPEVIDMMKGLMKPVGKVYDLLLERSGCHIIEVERLLEEERG